MNLSFPLWSSLLRSEDCCKPTDGLKRLLPCFGVPPLSEKPLFLELENLVGVRYGDWIDFVRRGGVFGGHDAIGRSESRSHKSKFACAVIK